jgi:hypothetical protein
MQRFLVITVFLLSACSPQTVSRTPAGIALTADLPVESAQAIDRGFELTAKRARCAGYTKGLDDFTRYKIEIMPSELSPVNHDPSYLVDAGKFKGSEWDRGDGKMYVGGQAYPPDTLRLSYVAGHDQYLSTVSANEFEHIVLARNDSKKYKATNGGALDRHPLLAPCPDEQ